MKNVKFFRLSLLLAFASVLSSGQSLAADAPKPAEAKSPEGCDCAKDKDGKVCGVDKDCCCTHQKATHANDKAKDDKGGSKDDSKDTKKGG